MAACSLAAQPLVVTHRRVVQAPVSGVFWVALFTKAPDADGSGGEELDVEGYERQQVGFDPPSSGKAGHEQRSSYPVSFAGIGRYADQVKNIVIIDADGNIFASGLAERRPGNELPEEIAVPRTGIQLRFSRG